jgi:D-lactate dehydrogenase
VACPVKIDTGVLVKELAGARKSGFARALALWSARHHGTVTAAARAGLRAAGILRALPLGPAVLEWATSALHAAAPSLVPRLGPESDLPTSAARLPRVTEVPPPRDGRGDGSLAGEGGLAATARRVVYFPSCLSRTLGPMPGEGDGAPATAAAMLGVLRWAGFAPAYPPDLPALCCGMPYASKGFAHAADVAADRAVDALWTASREGRDPVVTDASPCAGTLAARLASAARNGGRPLRIDDFPAFWAREVLPGLASPPRRPGQAVLHPTCTLVKTGGLPDFLAVARAHAEDVLLPASAGCCGFAGDKGFLVPELTASATAAEAAEVRQRERPDAGYFSTCRTCEIGMARAVGRPYRSLVHLVHAAVVDA